MIKPVSQNTEIQEKIRESVKEIIEEHDKSPNTYTIYKPDGSETEFKEFRTNKMRYYEDDLLKFEDLSRELHSTGHFTVDSIIEEEALKQGKFGQDDIIKNPEDRDRILREYQWMLARLTDATMTYHGGNGFDELSFYQAYSDIVYPSLEYPRKAYRITPIDNFRIESDGIRLYPHQIGDLNWDEDVVYLSLEPTEDSKIASVLTKHSRDKFLDSGVKRKYFNWTINTNTISYTSKTAERRLILAVAAALRLFSPEKPPISTGKIYTMKKGPIYKHNGTYDPGGGHGQKFKIPYSRPSNEYLLTKGEEEEFKEFWKKYGDFMDIGSKSRFSGAIRRHSYSYMRGETEDRIVDIVIGFESTLARDLGMSSSIMFRLSLRAKLLLANTLPYDQDVIEDFMKSIYEVRSEIVHKNESLHDLRHKFNSIDIFGDNPSEREIIRFARVMLAETIKEYIYQYKTNDRTITDINQDMDKAIRNTNWNPP